MQIYLWNGATVQQLTDGDQDQRVTSSFSLSTLEGGWRTACLCTDRTRGSIRATIQESR